MNIKSIIQRHPLVSFFVLAYSITWSAILIFLTSKGFQLANLQIQDGLIIFVMMFLGPSTSALILTAALDGRNGLREMWTRLTRWQVGFTWYVVALLTVPLLTLVIISALSALISPVYAPSFRVLGIVVGLLAGGFEEIGWTGFATPRLLNKHTWLISGLILGLVWSLWHLLADVSSHISSMGATGWVLWFVIYWILPLTAYRILMTWIYTKTQSLLLAQLMHASYSGWLFILSPATSDQDLLWQAIFAASLWMLVAIAAISQQRVARTLQPQTGKSY